MIADTAHLNEFSYNEKLSFTKVLENMIHADCKVEDEEILYFEEFKKRINLNDEYVIEAKNMETQKCIDILKYMSNAKKQIVYESLIELANADNEFHPNEKVLIDNICQLIKYTP
ncbi:TerB family tellurite resistance protein [Flammeovirga pacifica]|uniref:Co-chaperone DjlA N-terminal domain-containing protein n=1 Tax=Flammeovirga pacifica TaxID=915059 RepID=A0A1S1YSX8_FLAPC|nr:TerB family tellurite resistance protein [Flammeovirga pacifica]OHX64106.1 hypothetical protein NH26_21100 [Flammeovirga pacifica]